MGTACLHHPAQGHTLHAGNEYPTQGHTAVGSTNGAQSDDTRASRSAAPVLKTKASRTHAVCEPVLGAHNQTLIMYDPRRGQTLHGYSLHLSPSTGSDFACRER
jgi:hypothetical protein